VEEWEASWEKIPPKPANTEVKPAEPKQPKPKQEKKEPEKPKVLTSAEKGQLKKDAEQQEKLSDFQSLQELFDGVPEKGKKSLTEEQNDILIKLEPRTTADFNKLAAAIAARTKRSEENPHFPLFFRELCKLLTENMASSDVADAVKSLNIIVNDKIKVEKAPKKGMKKTAAKKKAVATTKNIDDEEEYEDEAGSVVGGGDYDDFMS